MVPAFEAEGPGLDALNFPSWKSILLRGQQLGHVGKVFAASAYFRITLSTG